MTYLERNPRSPRWASTRVETDSDDWGPMLGLSLVSGFFIGSVVITAVLQAMIYPNDQSYPFILGITSGVGVMLLTFFIIYVLPSVIMPKVFPPLSFKSHAQADCHKRFAALTPSQQSDMQYAYIAMLAAEPGEHEKDGQMFYPDGKAHWEAVNVFEKTLEEVYRIERLTKVVPENPHILAAEQQLVSLKSVANQLEGGRE